MLKRLTENLQINPIVPELTEISRFSMHPRFGDARHEWVKRPLFKHHLFVAVTSVDILTDFYIIWRDSGGRVVVLRGRLLVAGGAELQDGGGIARA